MLATEHHPQLPGRYAAVPQDPSFDDIVDRQRLQFSSRKCRHDDMTATNAICGPPNAGDRRVPLRRADGYVVFDLETRAGRAAKWAVVAR